MPLPLPDPQLPADPRDALESIQRNFDALATASTPSVTATATNASGITGTLTARKYADGLVILEGTLTRSGAGDLGTLPAGFIPANTIIVPVARASGSGVVTITNVGSISTSFGGSNSLSHVSFHAA